MDDDFGFVWKLIKVKYRDPDHGGSVLETAYDILSIRMLSKIAEYSAYGFGIDRFRVN